MSGGPEPSNSVRGAQFTGKDAAANPESKLVPVGISEIRGTQAADRAFPMNPLSKPAQRQSLAGARLRKHADYVRAAESGYKRKSASMNWLLAPQPAAGATGPSVAPAGPRVGLTAGKVLGKAHDRNRIKRRMREALRRHLELLPPGFDLIFFPRRSVLTIEFARLEAEVVRILTQARAEALGRAAGLP